MEYFKNFFSCFDSDKPYDPEDTNIKDLKIPLLISKVSEDETTIVAKDKQTLLKIVKKVVDKKFRNVHKNFEIDDEYIKIDNAKFFIEKLQIDETVRYSCNIVYTKLIIV
jgi:hypothetical protein